jgi:hypothetical protein
MKKLYTVEFEIPEIIVWAENKGNALKVANDNFKEHLDTIFVDKFAYYATETHSHDGTWKNSIPFGYPDIGWDGKTVDEYLDWLKEEVKKELDIIKQDKKQGKLDL